MFSPFKYLIKRAVSDAKKELKRELRDDIKDVVKDVCREMVAELFTEKVDTETKCLWGGGRVEKDTVVGALRKGIAAKVARDFSKKQNDIAINYITGEEFLDAVVDRIRKKQLSIPER